MEKEPMRVYGNGIINYFWLLFDLMRILLGIIVLFIPMFVIYSQGKEYEQYSVAGSNLMLGNLG